mmetsp:Transcript_43760/g.99971  ORF Transcript_43760/g.99971 Transcript_43760/m.99971 type:complete len:446 (-) Transcript_43760:781-2118(-)
MATQLRTLGRKGAYLRSSNSPGLGRRRGNAVESVPFRSACSLGMQQPRAGATVGDQSGIPLRPFSGKLQRRPVAASRLIHGQAMVTQWSRFCRSSGMGTAEILPTRTAEPPALVAKLRWRARWKTVTRHCQAQGSGPGIPEALLSQASFTHQTTTCHRRTTGDTSGRRTTGDTSGRKTTGDMSGRRTPGGGSGEGVTEQADPTTDQEQALAGPSTIRRLAHSNMTEIAPICPTSGPLTRLRSPHLPARMDRADRLSLWSGHLPPDRQRRPSVRSVTSDGTRTPRRPLAPRTRQGTPHERRVHYKTARADSRQLRRRHSRRPRQRSGMWRKGRQSTTGPAPGPGAIREHSAVSRCRTQGRDSAGAPVRPTKRAVRGTGRNARGVGNSAQCTAAVGLPWMRRLRCRRFQRMRFHVPSRGDPLMVGARPRGPEWSVRYIRRSGEHKQG